jgi:type VI secretion system protein ImpA
VPLRQDLLTPIAGDNPAGASLRYELVYGQIKEARTEEDETLPAGAWDRPVKRADLNLVVKLAGDALANRSKDLQLAVWLGEAVCKQEGISLLSPILQLCLELQQNFWEIMYPEIDDGDLGLRAAPLQWAANRYTVIVYGVGTKRLALLGGKKRQTIASSNGRSGSRSLTKAGLQAKRWTRRSRQHPRAFI